MKKLLGFAMVTVAVFVLSGCTGEGSGDEVLFKDYYITDNVGSGVSGIVWDCDGGTDGVTNNSGKFYTEARENCNLDLHTNLIVGDIYLEDNVGSLNGVQYSCVGNDAHPGTVRDFTGPSGFIDNASHFTSCTLFNLP